MAKKRDTQDITFPDQTIVNIDLENEMKTAFIDYAMSVIVARALPDVRDGLKPVHRRILYTMYEEGLTSDKKYSKSVATVGTVLRNYHPHGDTSVYDAMVRLAQDFSMRYPLVDGKGNFGSIDGDPAAAYRYTEARLDKLASEMLRDIDKETIDYTVNFDETRKEPVVITSRFPNLLVNGSMGIAVGMTTNVPPHNLRETIDATICVIKNPDATLDDLMEHIKGPDFPTGGIIMGRSGIRSAYGTGKGRIVVRAKTEFEEFGQGRTAIIVTEIPYNVNKSRLVENIAEQVKDKKIEGISGLRDESDREGMRIVIELKRDANPQVVLNRLFATTQLQTTFAAVLIALVNNQTQPKLLTLKEILDEYVAFQKEIITRRTRFDLRKAQERAHLLEGYRIAVDNIDEIIRIIRSSYNDARERLMERFGLSEIQAQAILEMQLRRLQGLEREKIEAEYQDLMEKIKYYNRLLSDPELLDSVLISELEEIRDKFGDDRRTQLAELEDEIDVEDLIEEEDCCYTLTDGGYIKRMPASTYKTQKRGGKGITAMQTREEDFVKTLFVASTHDYLLFFTNTGKVHRKKGYQIPEAGRTAKGTAIVNVLPLDPGEKVTAMLPVREFDESCLMFVTKMGTVKRLRLNSLHTARKAGIRALSLEEGDELMSVLKTQGNSPILIATANGQAACFDENDVRCMGRDASGVRGIRLAEGDRVVGAVLPVRDSYLLSVTEKGFGKRTAAEEFLPDEGGELHHRGGKGLRAYNVTEKTGPVAAVGLVTGDEDIMLLSDDGTMIRMAADGISIYGRSTQGVRVMRLEDSSRVIGLETVDRDEEQNQQ